MKVNVETITPDIAAQLLELNTGNFRKLDPGRVSAYSQAMRATGAKTLRVVPGAMRLFGFATS